MSGGQTALTCGLAPGLHVCVCVCVCVCVFWGFLWVLHVGLTLMPLSEKVLMTQTALALSLTPHLSIYTFSALISVKWTLGEAACSLITENVSDLCNKQSRAVLQWWKVTMYLYFLTFNACAEEQFGVFSMLWYFILLIHYISNRNISLFIPLHLFHSCSY